MKYPQAHEYIESIRSAEKSFATLKNLRAVLDDNGNPIMINGNNSIIFKLIDIQSCKFYAVKCFTKDKEGRDAAYNKIEEFLSDRDFHHVIPIKYLQDELYVDSEIADQTEISIAIMEWIEGDNLDNYIRLYSGNSFQLHNLCISFAKLCQELVQSPISHGDIRPENIIVQPNGDVKLVDYDDMYVPTIGNEKDRQADDFSLAVIALTIKAASISFGLLNQYGHIDRFLCTHENCESLHDNVIFKHLTKLMCEDPSIIPYINTFMRASKHKRLTQRDFEYGELEIAEMLNSRTSFGHFSRHDEPMDENGVIYSHDGTRVLAFDYQASDAVDIKVKEGVICICEGAFYSYKQRKLNISLPKSLRFFTRKSLDYSYNRLSWDTPWFTYSEGFIYTADFTGCIIQQLDEAKIDDRVKVIERNCFAGLDIKGIILPKNLLVIREHAFDSSAMNEELVIPENVFSIESHAFTSCTDIRNVKFNTKLHHIGDWCFSFCKKLEIVTFPLDCFVKTINHHVFHYCESLKTIQFPANLFAIENEAFQWCGSIEELDFPKTLTKIGCQAFNMDNCSSSCQLQILILPQNLSFVGERAFNHYNSINNIFVKSTAILFGKEAFRNCSELYSFQAKKLKHLSERMFCDCRNLESVICPELTSIDSFAFESCSRLNFQMPDSLNEINVGAFNGVLSITTNSKFSYEDGFLFDAKREKLITCNNLNRKIVIPDGTRYIQRDSFASTPDYLVLPSSISDKSISEALGLDAKFVQLPQGRKVDDTLEIIEKEEGDIRCSQYYISAKLFGDTPVYIDNYGVVYSEDKKTLLKYSSDIDLKSYSILSECESISDNAFEGGMEYDPEFGAYYWGNKLKSLLLPPKVKSIGKEALLGCRELERLDIPCSVTELKESALKGCRSIKELTIPRSIIEIGKNALPVNLEHIQNQSPNFCTYGECLLTKENEIIWLSSTIKHLDLPNNVTYRGRKCVTYSDCIVSTQGELLMTVDDIKTFEFPKGIKTIANGAFGGNNAIEEIQIPEGVERIEKGGFGCNQSLKEIYLPSTLKYIGDLRTYQGWGRKYIEFFYPKKIHVPRGMTEYFKKLLPGIPKGVLIDDCAHN